MCRPWVAQESPRGLPLLYVADPWVAHGSPMCLMCWPMGPP